MKTKKSIPDEQVKNTKTAEKYIAGLKKTGWISHEEHKNYKKD